MQTIHDTFRLRPWVSLAVLLTLACHCLHAQKPQAGRYELSPDQRNGTIRQIFVLCHSHLDIGFTRPPDEVARGYKDNIDAAIKLTRENADFRWTIESAWMLEEWLRRTDDEALVQEISTMLRDRRMALGMAFATMHSGLMAPEESNRMVYFGGEIPAAVWCSQLRRFPERRSRIHMGLPSHIRRKRSQAAHHWFEPRLWRRQQPGPGKKPILLGGTRRQPGAHLFHVRLLRRRVTVGIERAHAHRGTRALCATAAGVAREERLPVRHLSANGIPGR